MLMTGLVCLIAWQLPQLMVKNRRNTYTAVSMAVASTFLAVIVNGSLVLLFAAAMPSLVSVSAIVTTTIYTWPISVVSAFFAVKRFRNRDTGTGAPDVVSPQEVEEYEMEALRSSVRVNRTN